MFTCLSYLMLLKTLGLLYLKGLGFKKITDEHFWFEWQYNNYMECLSLDFTSLLCILFNTVYFYYISSRSPNCFKSHTSI